MATDPPQPPEPAEKPEEQSSRVRLWLIVLAVLALVVGLIVYSYADLPGSGYMGVADKKIWDYLDLLIVPAALALGVYLLNLAQSTRERKADELQQRRDRKAEETRKEHELEVENQRAQDEALRAYFDSMENLLLRASLRHSAQDSETRLLARARTLTILSRLDGNRKGSVLQFLYEAGLIAKAEPMVRLNGANLEGTIAPGTIVLSATTKKEWSSQGVSYTVEVETGANLEGASLVQVNLSKANLENASLTKANLSYTSLREANLTGANLQGANLMGADLEGAILKKTTMPNGQRYERYDDWVEDSWRSRRDPS